ncbi:hypothetical protein WJX72_006273 [[Myrmecia] bisecta]|uniref:Flavodoxin-like domain-containing protein n=1 Tax=[Myrmecia] bisecta TaxID=41462 RepID=A0AAW1Q7F8_9CHLO
MNWVLVPNGLCLAGLADRHAGIVPQQSPLRPLSFFRNSYCRKPTPFRLSHRLCALSARASQIASLPQDKAKQPGAQAEVPVDFVQAVPLTRGTTCLRGVCSRRLKFEIEYGAKRGSTDNSYLVQEGSDTILIDVPDSAYTQKFVTALDGLFSLGSLTHVVLTHLTPSRVESIKQLLRMRQQQNAAPLQIYLSNPALQLLQSTLGKTEEDAQLLANTTLTAARVGGDLLVGSEGGLQLIPVPTPRWPDLLCAYSPSQQLLFTSKLFGAHVAPSVAGTPDGCITDLGGWDVFGSDWRFYFDCMLAPVARQAAGALARLDDVLAPRAASPGLLPALLTSLQATLLTTQAALERTQTAVFGAQVGAGGRKLIAAICPMHGPVVSQATRELLGRYRDWVAEQIASAEQCRVAVLYASAYGNTAALAQAISRGVTKAGVAVETVNLESTPLEEVSAIVNQSAGFVIGSPTLGGHMPTQVAAALGAVLRDNQAKALPCGVFGSFGWSGEAVDEMEQRLRDAGFCFAFDAMRVKFRPTARDIQVAEESGTDLAQAVRRQQKRQQKAAGSAQVKAGGASSMEQAVGRVVGSLCVLTSKDEDAESAMLASWVSQASFDPPGVSIAVKKDRAVESLMTRNSKFVLNILAEGKEKPILKQLLKPFKPGEERFGELATSVSEGTGCRILPGIASYVECSVTDRMEAGDHWVVYATVEGGQVVDDQALSAVHHRKAGLSY